MRLYVAKSRIPSAGGGLFADEPIPRGALIGRYTGVDVSIDSLRHSRVVRGYVCAVGSKLIDASDEEGRLVLRDGTRVDCHRFTQRDWDRFTERGVGWEGVANLLRFANHAVGGNARLVGAGLRARRAIRPHEEITYNYGSRFFQDVHDDVCSACSVAGGKLVCCDMCTRAYHLACVGIASARLVPAIWVCPACRRRRATRTRPQTPRQSLSAMSTWTPHRRRPVARAAST